MSKVVPILPSEVVKKHIEDFPDEVITAFNTLIAQNFNGHSSTVKQKDVVKLIVAAGIDEKEIFKKCWLDIEGLFITYGWKVEYNQPAYCDNYFEPYFVFSK